MRFLGIFSNNADEFYRVRVAAVKRLVALKADKKKLPISHETPSELLKDIQKVSAKLNIRFEQTYRKLVTELESNGIRLINEKQCTKSQLAEIATYFTEVVRTRLVPIMMGRAKTFPVLLDKSIYLAIKMEKSLSGLKPQYALIELPTSTISRFKVLESSNNQQYIIMLDDIVRAHLKDIFSIFDYQEQKAFTFKLTRDAELDIDNADFSIGLLEQMSKSVNNRKKANAVRFVYDRKMPEDLKSFLFKNLKLIEDENVIPGGRYHNFKDFMKFPSLNQEKHVFKRLPPLSSPSFQKNKSVLEAIKKEDIMLNYPYQSFDPIIDMLREAAMDPKVKSIKINVYRVAENSKVMNALINAAKNGKEVVALIELQARFDEEHNIYWSNKLKNEGVRVILGVRGLKVHSKLILITRKEGVKTKQYAHIGTGNFHEGTANVYCDTSLLTADERLTSEVDKVFDFFDNNFKTKHYSHLILSPSASRRKFMQLINQEIRNSKKGEPGHVILKLNNLVDTEMIKKLYQASQAGVKIDLIIRGMCSLRAGIKGLSENIHAVSIVGRFLEHSRIAYFKNGGNEKIYISSADWMTRNFDLRVEVSTPIYNERLKKTLLDMLTIQLKDNTKARYLGTNLNEYVRTKEKNSEAQIRLYNYFKNQLN